MLAWMGSLRPFFLVLRRMSLVICQQVELMTSGPRIFDGSTYMSLPFKKVPSSPRYEYNRISLFKWNVATYHME